MPKLILKIVFILIEILLMTGAVYVVISFGHALGQSAEFSSLTDRISVYALGFVFPAWVLCLTLYTVMRQIKSTGIIWISFGFVVFAFIAMVNSWRLHAYPFFALVSYVVAIILSFFSVYFAIKNV
jgi:hypothetical protein